jgi:histidyl-tRNA synthetase
MDLSLPRGMRDLQPEDYEALERVRDSFIEIARIFGFRLMEPSPIELIQTLEAKSGPGVRNEVYYFQDKAGRDVGLRFDLTVGLTRYVVSNRGLPSPIKIGAFSGMWRYDEPQYGRYRWFYQWDAEIFGPKSVEADAEIIAFASALFDRLGLKEVSIEIGDRGVTEEFIRGRIGVQDDARVLALLRAVDKLAKKSVEEVLEEYSNVGVDSASLNRLIEFGQMKGEPESVLKRLGEEKLERIGDLSRLIDLLKARQVPNVKLNLGIVRGLDYYTGVVFEVFERNNPSLGALAGGGRYDILPKIFGREDLGATGVAGGVERTVLALQKIGAGLAADKRVYVGYVGESMMEPASEIASRLRRSGLPTDLELSGRGLRKQLESASKSAAVFVLVGPRDYAGHQVTLRDMRSGVESQVALENLEVEIKSLIQIR